MSDALLPPRPVLHLSGPKLRAALEQLIMAAEGLGGVERFAGAVRLRAEVLQDRIGDGRGLSRAALEEVLPLLPTVRRRIGGLLDAKGWPALQEAIETLLDDVHVPGTADARMAQFEAALQPSRAPGADADRSPLSVKTGRTRAPRFLRDLAAELLHGLYPEPYPLMTRWVWDAHANTGALREIWHDPITGDDVDRIVIDVPDGYETFLVLREELALFLSDNGIFRDTLWYVDLLLAQVYGGYVAAQGSVYLKADFQSEGDPLEHTRRILGLDRVGRTSGGASRRASEDVQIMVGDQRGSTPTERS